MRKAVLAAALVFMAVGAVAPVPAAAQTSRPTVAVLDLDFGTVERWWDNNWDIGKGIADLMVDELVNDGTYRIIERKKLAEILGEQNFSNSDRADPSAATLAKVGKVLGVKYMIVGSVTKFGTEKKETKVGGGGWGGGGFGLGKVGTSKGKATVGITARIIDTSTAEIMASARASGESSRGGLMLGGGGGKWGGAGMGDIDMGSSDYRETIIGEATEAAVKDLVTKLVAAKARLGS